jgi:hypothetical protein
MARIIYSALVENIKGSIAGTTFQSNKYGYTAKKKPNMIKPRSETQQRQQHYMSLAVSAWKALTSAQRTDWETWAATYPQYAKFNPAAELSGYAVFVRVHILRFMAGLAVDTNPTYTSYSTDTLTYVLSRYPSYFQVEVYSTLEDENWRINFSLSRPFQATQTNIGSKCRYIDTYSNLTDDFQVTTKYLELYGSLPNVGNFVALRTKVFGKDNGQVLAEFAQISEVQAV